HGKSNDIKKKGVGMMEKQQIRNVTMTTGYIKHPEGSVLIEAGGTKVICNASIENRVPPFLRGQNKGWIFAEYAMLPRATEKRNIRESSKGKVSGRTMEIQRLIGRSLRAVVDLDAIGERTIWIDCDVIQADGGTRTASITGAIVALALACDTLFQDGVIDTFQITDFLGAISTGVMNEGDAVLDLDYEKDFAAAVDMNVVMTGNGEFVEIQGTGEESTFSYQQLQTMLKLAQEGIEALFLEQKAALGSIAKQIRNEQQKQEGSTMDEIIIATKNKGKAKEFQALFEPHVIRIKTLLDFLEELPDIEETGSTFTENARLKAEGIAKMLKKPVIADDSGLEVAALEGRPGVYSARFAGEPKDDTRNN